MPFSFRLGNLRLRLTLWYGTAFAALLLTHIGVATYVHYRQLLDQEFHAAMQDVSTAEGLLYETPDSKVSMNEDYFNNPTMRLQIDRLLEVVAPDGQILYQNRRLKGVRLGGPPLLQEGTGSYNKRLLKLSDGRSVLAVSHFHLLNGRPIILRLAYDEAPLVANVLKCPGSA